MNVMLNKSSDNASISTFIEGFVQEMTMTEQKPSWKSCMCKGILGLLNRGKNLLGNWFHRNEEKDQRYSWMEGQSRNDQQIMTSCGDQGPQVFEE